MRNELEKQMGGSLPPSQYPQQEQTAHYAWYSTKKPFPQHLLEAFYLCRICDGEGLRDGQVRYKLFQEHVLREHGISPEDYASLYDQEFPVWYQKP